MVPDSSRGQASSEEDLQEQLLLLQSPLGMGASTNSAVQCISSFSVLENPEETNSESKKKSRKQLKNHHGSGFKFLRQRALSRCMFDNSKPDERKKDQPRSILLLSSADHHQKCPKAQLSPVKRGGTLKALYKRLTIDTHNTSSAPNNLDAAASPDGCTKESPEQQQQHLPGWVPKILLFTRVIDILHDKECFLVSSPRKQTVDCWVLGKIFKIDGGDLSS